MITLVADGLVATINPDGAWLETLMCDDTPILFPKSAIENEAGETKARGGMHVCLPNFGPGGESGLAQHGFGRTSLWSVLQQDDTSVVLELRVTEGNYSGLVADLQYELRKDSLTTSLSLRNDSTALLRVAPGFHPYFSLESSETAVTVNGELFQLEALAGTEYRDASSAELVTSRRHIALTTENLTSWAIWTDLLGSYVCVEPTFGGNRFLEPEQADEQLESGTTKSYSVRISW